MDNREKEQEIQFKKSILYKDIRKGYAIFVVVLTLIFSVGYMSYAMFTITKEKKNSISIVTGELLYNLKGTGLTNNEISLEAGQIKEIEVTIESLNSIESAYQLYYNNNSNISIKYVESTDKPTQEKIGAHPGEDYSKKTTIIIENKSNSKQTVIIGVQGGLVGKELTLEENRTAINEVAVYSITNKSVTGGSITIGSSGVVGNKISFTTTPSTGYSYNGAEITNASGESIITLDATTKSFTMPAMPIIITPKWKANNYKIEYTLNGGTKGTTSPTAATYDSVVTISNPTKTVTVTGNVNGTGASIGSATSKAQNFAGWTASSLNTSTAMYGTSSTAVTTAWSNASTKVTAQYFKNLTATSGGTVTLTANWTPVAFNLPTITKTGYTCKWNTKADGSGTDYASGESYTPGATSAASITMYAKCTANSYTIGYTLNGGTNGSNAPTTATYDSVVTISNPTKTVTVTGNVNGTGASVGSATSKAQTFAGWTASSLNTSTAMYGTSSTAVTTAWSNASTKVTAQYFKNLTVTGGETVTLTANWTPVAFNLPTVTKTGYSCKWNTKADGSGTDYASGASYTPGATSGDSVTMYAKCTANSYNIGYTLNGGTAGTSAPTTATYDSVVTISNPTRTVTVTGNVNGTGASVGSATSKAQTFAGWTATNLNTSTAMYGTSSTAVTTAWSNASTKVTAQYFKNLTATSGGTVTLTANWTAVAFNLPTVTKTGYACKWNTKEDGSGTEYVSGASYTPSATSGDSVTMYAQCTANSYGITNNATTGGTITIASSANYGSTVSFTTSASTGYTYNGATVTNASGTTVATLDSSTKSFSMPASDVTVTPKWSLKVVEVTFYRNYDSNDTTTATQSFTYGKGGSFDSGFSRTGYTALGWTRERGSNVIYHPFNSSVADSWIDETAPSVNLYAIWTLANYSISSRSVTGGSITVANTANYGSTVTFTTNPSSGFNYYGATIRDVSGNILMTLDSSTKSFTMPAQAVTISPKWKYDDYVLFAVDTGAWAFYENNLVDGNYGSFVYDSNRYYYNMSFPITGDLRKDAWTTQMFDLTHYDMYWVKATEYYDSTNEHNNPFHFTLGVNQTNTEWIRNVENLSEVHDGQGSSNYFDIHLSVSDLTGNYYLGLGVYNNKSEGIAQVTHAFLTGKVYE